MISLRVSLCERLWCIFVLANKTLVRRMNEAEGILLFGKSGCFPSINILPCSFSYFLFNCLLVLCTCGVVVLLTDVTIVARHEDHILFCTVYRPYYNFTKECFSILFLTETCK